MSSKSVAFAASTLYYISSDEEEPPPTNSLSSSSRLKRPRTWEEDLREKLAFNHAILAQNHSLLAEAYRHQFRMKDGGIADLALLQDIIKFVDGRITDIVQLQSMPIRPTPVLASTPPPSPRKTRARKREGRAQRSESPTRVKGDERTIEVDIETKRKLSLFRADTPPSEPVPPTPFDLLLQRQSLTVPASLPQTTRTKKKPDVGKSPLKDIQGTVPGRTDSNSTVSTSKTTSKCEDQGRSTLLVKLNAYRRKASTEQAILPDQILTLETLKKLCEQPPADYKHFERILVETSGIPETNVEERRAYVQEKVKCYGADLLQICLDYVSKRMDNHDQEASCKRTNTSTSTFKRTISVHSHISSTEKSGILEMYRYDS